MKRDWRGREEWRESGRQREKERVYDCMEGSYVYHKGSCIGIWGLLYQVIGHRVFRLNIKVTP